MPMQKNIGVVYIGLRAKLRVRGIYNEGWSV